MRRVGTISELWRYPVSSVTGEQVEEVEVSQIGMIGDRRYALVDSLTGIVAHPERDQRWQKAIFIRSRTTATGIEILVPEHDWQSVDDPDLAKSISQFLDFEADVRPYERTREASRRDAFALDRYDVSPLHLLTSASVDHLKTLHPGGNPDRRRFRPNILMQSEPDISGFAELGWIDAGIRLGEVGGKVIAPTKRCGFTIIEQEGIANDPEILRNVMRFGNRNMGVYCAPDASGTLRVGDGVFLSEQ
ncbi:MOSC N-terminal beta barrel domain-containing protein [Rhizobium sp. AN80A]|uniref:MOSC domain-containing protein n=1 Tax=Rhizobium sp. AN80A TaxID=3040673 RepID=UPI0024B37F44|nr:MOSC N-terminal beta barrel domain-containing protein [Rhizobium sp. AN80A]